jgi:hypothetical protein
MFPRIILFEISNVHQQILKSRNRPAAAVRVRKFLQG